MSRPVLLIHGQQDQLIPPAAAQQLYAAAGRLKALCLVPGSEHVRACLQVLERYVARLTTFFQQAIGGEPPVRRSPVQTASSPGAGVQMQEAVVTPPGLTTPVKGASRLGLAWGRWLVRWQWGIIGLWMLVLVVSLPLATTAGAVLQPGGTTVPGGEAEQVQTVLLQRLHLPATQLFAILSIRLSRRTSVRP